MVNVVAMEMLRTKIPPAQVSIPQMLDNRRMAGCGSSDEDPYSIAGSGSSGSSGNGNTRNRSSSRDKPPQLPPRDNGIYGPLWQDPQLCQEQEEETEGKVEDDGWARTEPRHVDRSAQLSSITPILVAHKDLP